jgi:hypothetical protein
MHYETENFNHSAVHLQRPIAAECTKSKLRVFRGISSAFTV